MKLLKLSIQRASWRTAAFNFFAILLAFGLCLQSAHGAGKPGGGGGVPGNPAIAYVADDVQLKVMDPDGANQRLLFKTRNGRVADPFWHPDGQWIYFRHWTGSGSDNSLYRINVDGTGQTKVLALNPPNTITQGDVSPVVSPNGKRLMAFTDFVIAGASWYMGLFLANDDGTGRKQIALGVGSPGRPTWSPDGRHLAYSWSGGADDSSRGLRLLTFGWDDIGNIWVESDVLLLSSRNLDGLGFNSLSAPSFSKTEHKIYFSGGPDLCCSLDAWALHLDDLMNPRLLGAATAGVSEWGISGSSDDSKIAYELLDNGSLGIYVANSDGSNPVAMPRPVIKGTPERQRFPAFKR